MIELENLLNEYNKPYSLDDDRSGTMKRQKIRLEVMNMLPDLLEEMKELNRLFDLQHERTQEADKLWQEEHNMPDILPDLGKLIAWLLFKINSQKEIIIRQSEELGTKSLQIEAFLNRLKDIKDTMNICNAEDIIDEILEDFVQGINNAL